MPFTSPLVKPGAQEIADEEMKHVEFLRAALIALTGSVIGRPAWNFSSSFTTLANLAGLGSDFNAYANDMSFLLAAYVFEDVGVTAYHGAAPLISNKAILDKAAGILAPQAYSRSRLTTLVRSAPRFSLSARKLKPRRSLTCAQPLMGLPAPRTLMIAASAMLQPQQLPTAATP